MARNRPWFKVDLHYDDTPLVVIAHCGAVYPWVIAVLRRNKNEADDLDIDPRVCASKLSLPLEIATAQIEAMKSHGLVIKGEDGFWRDPNWEEAAPDARPPSHKRVANKSTAASGTERDASGSNARPTAKRDEVGSHGSRARVDLDLDLEGDPEREGDPDPPPPRAARIQPIASASVPARPASPGGKWWERMGEEHGLGVIPIRQTGADGKPLEPRRWSFGGLKIAMQRLWPNEPVLQPNGPGFAQISRFITELCDEPADLIDRLLETVAPHGVLLAPDRLNRPYELKHELARLKNGGKPGSRFGAPRSAPSAAQREDSFIAAAMAAERARLATVPDELWDLAQTMAVAGEATDDEELRALIVGEYRRRNVAIPPVFRAPKAGAA